MEYYLADPHALHDLLKDGFRSPLDIQRICIEIRRHIRRNEEIKVELLQNGFLLSLEAAMREHEIHVNLQVELCRSIRAVIIDDVSIMDVPTLIVESPCIILLVKALELHCEDNAMLLESSLLFRRLCYDTPTLIHGMSGSSTE
jgi:hypothetical protein